MPLSVEPPASKPSQVIGVENLPGEILLNIASLLPYSCDGLIPEYFDDVEDRDFNGDFSNFMAACVHAQNLVHNNATSLAKTMAQREYAIAAVLHPPLASQHYIDDWIPELNIKTKAVEDLIQFVKWIHCYGKGGTYVECAETLSTEQHGDKFARVGLHIYQKIGILHSDYEEKVNRHALIMNLPRTALLLLKYITYYLYIGSLIRCQLLHHDAPGRVQVSHIIQALERLLFETGLPSVIPALFSFFINNNYHHYPARLGFSHEARECPTSSKSVPLWSSASADCRCISQNDDRALQDALRRKFREPNGSLGETWWRLQSWNVDEMQKLVEDELGDKPVEQVIEECLPILANPGDFVSIPESLRYLT